KVKAAMSTTAISISDSRDTAATQSAHPKSVPHVPGAGRIRPLPNPKETIRGNDLNTQAAVGLNKAFICLETSGADIGSHRLMASRLTRNDQSRRFEAQ